MSCKEERSYIIDMVYSLHRFGAMFTEYFLFDFPNLNVKGRESFITDKFRYIYCDIMNDSANITLFDNKEKTFALFSDFYGREVLFINSRKCYNEFLSFIGKHASFIKKPSHSSSGRGVEKLTITDYRDNEQLFDYLLSCGPCMIEEIVTNHKSIQKIFPHALSTVRIPTIRTKRGIEIFACYTRFGREGLVVDNVGSGGIVAGIDIKTGTVETAAYDKNGNKYLYHEYTNERIIGLIMPEWDEALSLARKLSDVVPTNRYVGWDLAYTENGWIMIEGNARGEFYGQQFVDRIGKRKWLEELIVS